MLAAYGILYVIIICILYLNVTDKIVTPGWNSEYLRTHYFGFRRQPVRAKEQQVWRRALAALPPSNSAWCLSLFKTANRKYISISCLCLLLPSRFLSSLCGFQFCVELTSQTMDNTIGDVPLEWYREDEHIGYDADGRKLFKITKADSIEHLLQMVDDPSYWRTVFDEKGGGAPQLSKTQVWGFTSETQSACKHRAITIH